MCVCMCIHTFIGVFKLKTLHRFDIGFIFMLTSRRTNVTSVCGCQVRIELGVLAEASAAGGLGGGGKGMVNIEGLGFRVQLFLVPCRREFIGSASQSLRCLLWEM